MAIMDVVILFAVVISLAYFGATVWVWTVIIGVILLLLPFFSHIGFFALAIFWMFYLFAACFANFRSLRLQYFSKPLVKKLQPRMPAISQTEREAIEAGDVWWEKELFCGRPNWKKLLAIPKPMLNAEEESFLANQVETLCTMLDDWEILKNHDLPSSVWNYLKQERFLGMVIPKEYGGRGFSALAHSTVVVKIATRCVSAAVNTMVPNSLGPAELLVHYGTTEQKNYYLPRLATGEEIPCFALTGPEAGSDAGAITDKGIVCRDIHEGKEVLGIRLTWDKRYITLAPVATVLGLAFRLFDPDQLLGSKQDMGITLCLVPTSHPGVEIGERHSPMNLAFMNGPTRGDNVFIPMDWIIGGVAMAGNGWRMLMECLSIGRSISLPALSTACAKLAYRVTGAYSGIRRQFNTSISNFEGVQEALGYIAGLTYQVEACRIMTAGAVDLNIRPSIVSAIAKYQMTEFSRHIINYAMDIHAGQGVQMGPRNFLAPAYLALPVSITVEGANILTRNLIIFGQGAIRCHPFVLQEVELLSSNDEKKEEKFDKLLLSHIGYFIRNLSRSFWLGLTGSLFVLSPVRGKTARFYRQLTRMSSVLALLSDISMMILGGDLKRKERISARLGDVLSQLYLASTVLKYYQDSGQQPSDLDYVQWCVESCLSRMQIACDELLNNFPLRWLGKILSVFIFPLGQSYYPPRDDLHQKISQAMLVPSELRDRLTKYCFESNNSNDAVHRLEIAFAKRTELAPLLQKFKNISQNGKVLKEKDFEKRAQVALLSGVLTEAEIQALRDFQVLEKEIIRVNEFSFDLNTVIS